MIDHGHGSVFCVGLAIQDTILSVEAIPTARTKIYANARREVGGGPAATAAVAIARLGGRATLAARVGADGSGAAIVTELQGEGVDTSWLKRLDGVQSPGAVILLEPDGERLIVAYADPDMPADAAWLEPEGLGGALLCDLFWPEAAIGCLDMARREGVPSVLDADISRQPRDLVERIVAATDYVIFSRPGLRQFTGEGEIEAGLRAARRSGHRLTAVTDGADGLYWLEGDRLENLRSPAITPVDTVGAGDAFHGAFALAISCGRAVSQAVRFANSVAALKCLSPGGRAGLPTRDLLSAFDPTLDLDWLPERSGV